MDPITLAVISDLHIGYARAKDLWPIQDRTSQEQQVFDKLVDTNYREGFLNFIREKEISADYLVVPGDISNSGQHAQLQLASIIISEIAEALRVVPENVLYVPGNHDLDWEMMKRTDPTNFYKGIRYVALRDERLIFEQIMQRGNGHMLDEPCFSSWDYSNLVAVGYNSSWEDGPEKQPHHGAIIENHRLRLEKYLAEIDLSPSRLRLFIVHHHPYHYSDPDPDYPDFSLMTNAPNLMDTLRSYNFDLIIHGHKHWPKFTVDYNLTFPIAILGAGSFSARIYGEWQGKVDNLFHLIKVEGRDRDKNHILGKVLSWTYLSGWGWKESQKLNGIVHKYPFGSYYQQEELEKAIKPILEREFNVSRAIEWSKIIEELPYLEHLTPEQNEQVLNRLSEEMGFDCHRTPDVIILLMR